MAVTYGLAIMAQQTVLNGGISIDIPSDAQKITKEEALAHAGKKFNNDKLALLSVTHTRAKRIYKVNDILVSINFSDEALSVKDSYLSDMKKGLDVINKRGNTGHYTSNLKKINNNPVLILNSIQGNVGYYDFYCLNFNHTKEVTGTLHYDKADANEAKAVLDHLLNSIQFKD